jgi:hypothetical protein
MSAAVGAAAVDVEPVAVAVAVAAADDTPVDVDIVCVRVDTHRRLCAALSMGVLLSCGRRPTGRKVGGFSVVTNVYC